MLQAISSFGVGKSMANAIVAAVDTVGYAAIAASAIAVILSGGGLSVGAATLDYAIIYIEAKLRKTCVLQQLPGNYLQKREGDYSSSLFS